MKTSKKRKRREGELRGMSIGATYAASTAWVQYYFNPSRNNVTIQVYRYSWVVWEKTRPLNQFFTLRAEAVAFCKDWKFQYVRERVLKTMSERIVLKHQDGTPVEPEKKAIAKED